ncbi:major facilitator superfamily transporter [Colletotrichum zoysiae]|uniref:Major facilitator superfamily transporter n=1 Tax=Colletotrichum zoysiae TaxID=1216348 RepID=A0AAD9HUL6_9PEZI|nr:major facilitator superfamily transporter [Colletotrichum zoysiae]
MTGPGPGPSGDGDDALAVVGARARPYDPAVAARAVRKIDRFLVPAMVLGYGLVYYDKAILGSAVLFGMTADLRLSVPAPGGAADTSRLSWATSLFYFGMLAGLYPMAYALQRFPPGRALGAVVLLWAAACASAAAVADHRGLYAQRLALGFVEAAVPTAFMCVVAGYYTQAEQSLRQSWWFSATGLFTVVGGGLNYAFAQVPRGGGARGLRPWQAIYVLAGCLTFLFGLACFFLPASPVSAWFLTPEERLAAVERLRRGQTGVRCATFKPRQLREAVADAKVWLVALMMASAYTMNGAVSGFGPLIVSTFGWSPLEAILLQFPLGGICFASILLTGYLGSRLPNGARVLMLAACCLPVVAGCAIIWRSDWAHHAAAPVVGYSLTGFFGAVVSLVISLGMSNVAGHTKKSFVAATVFVAYCVGNIVGPQLVRSQSKARHYPELWLGLIVCYVVCLLAAAALYRLLRAENRRRDALPVDEEERAKMAFQDLTDKENPYFRYVY